MFHKTNYWWKMQCGGTRYPEMRHSVLNNGLSHERTTE